MTVTCSVSGVLADAPRFMNPRNGGSQFCSFKVNHQERGSQNSTFTSFINIVIFRTEIVEMTRDKTAGAPVTVGGVLHVRKWTDTEGKEQRTIEIIASSAVFSSAQQAQQHDAPAQPYASRPPAHDRQHAPQQTAATSSAPRRSFTDDEIPF